MLVSTTSQYDTPDIAIIDHSWGNPQLWLKYFDIEEAWNSFSDHIASKRSDKTPEQHTRKVYEAGLRYFLGWSEFRLPTEALIDKFIAHLLTEKGGSGVSPSTVNAKYLAPVRKFLEKLAAQSIKVTGHEREFVHDCKEQIRLARAVKGPEPSETTDISPLWDPRFTRLTLEQVNRVLRSIDITTKSGMRDFALLHIAFSTGLRIAELHRITLASIKPIGDGGYTITVRGKRSKMDPVKLTKAAYDDLMDYVDMYNNGLDDDDPRRITSDPIMGDDGKPVKVNGKEVYMPVWQPMVHGDNYMQVGVNRFDPKKGMSIQSLRNIIERRTENALGEKLKLAAHDTRRTAASIAYDNGMPLNEIQAMLRHKNAGVTLRYVGTKPDYKSLGDYVTFG